MGTRMRWDKVKRDHVRKSDEAFIRDALRRHPYNDRPTVPQRTYLKALARQTDTDLDTNTIRSFDEASALIDYLKDVRAQQGRAD